MPQHWKYRCHTRSEGQCLLTRALGRRLLQVPSQEAGCQFDALLARAAKYINMEEAQAAKKETRGEKRKEIKEETPSKKPRVDLPINVASQRLRAQYGGMQTSK
ncbi:UNVERIFIED_CONTAM: hypothetical protein Slati_2406200 [Sesamum latifolium]|uniref:Uncharacterized protein n=1 Tax=Sesamum latifolium TaxID=2727402 RepID=A0AAW2WFU1_9LAMI